MKKTKIDGVLLPRRMCVICRKRFAKPELDRHVVTVSGILEFDNRQVMSGRGWYCCRAAECRKKFAFWKPGRKRKSGAVVGR